MLEMMNADEIEKIHGYKKAAIWLMHPTMNAQCNIFVDNIFFI